MKVKLLLLLLICLLLALLIGPDYQYESVSILSDNPALASAISALVSLPAPVLFFPYLSIRASILNSEPSLSNVIFRPVYSGGFTLEIVPVEREPVAIVENRNQVAYMDRDGIVFRYKNYVPNLPRVDLPSDASFVYGGKLDTPAFSALLESLPLFNSLPQSDFYRLALDPGGNWSLFTKDGICVKTGGEGKLEEKLSVLLPILRVVRDRRISAAYIDVSSVKMPVIKLDREK